MTSTNQNSLSSQQTVELLRVVQARFEENMIRHQGLIWIQVQAKLQTAVKKLWSLNQMEIIGGEPDVVSYDNQTGEYTFYDCSRKSPSGRKSLCYDNAALKTKKENKPRDSAVSMGIELLTERQYRELQSYEKFDTKTSSWIQTPDAVRKLGGALFGDCRYDQTFVYHNGDESYYAARGFRGLLRV